MCDDMLKVMYATRGIGLSAPQVGINLQLMVFNKTPRRLKTFERILINPSIVERSEETESDEESCLSFPEVYGHVTRAKWLVVSAMNLQGEHCKYRIENLEARIFQHEYDHLNSVSFIWPIILVG
jgi:peptide deformylase